MLALLYIAPLVEPIAIYTLIHYVLNQENQINNCNSSIPSYFQVSSDLLYYWLKYLKRKTSGVISFTV